MEYRRLGKTDISLSALGFGTMRLPTIDGVFNQVDIPKAKELVRKAIDSGVNYVDTAYPYHGNGFSESAVKEILADGYRDKVYLGDKLSVWFCESYEDCEAFFEGQLERCGTDHFDLYVLHSLAGDLWEKAKKLDVFRLFEQKKKEGKIKYLGFSFHDSYELFQEIADYYPWDFCILQYNFMDTDHQAGERGLRYAAQKGMGVLIMEPLKGGQLANETPKEVAAVWAKSKHRFSSAGRGISFVLNRPEVTTVLSGMNEMAQVEENIALANQCTSGFLDAEEEALYPQARAAYESLIQIPCTRCRYCMPCPAGVDIPNNFDYYNMGHMYQSIEHAKNFYNRPYFDPMRSTNCVNCGQCIDKCPQNLPIPDLLKKISEEWAK